MTASAKILAVDDEPDFELLIRQRFRRQIRDEEFKFRFARHGEEALTYTPRASELERERVRRAAAACPVQAILVEEEAGPGVQ